MEITHDGGNSMSPWAEGLLVKYGAVLLGVGVGTAAKYSLSRGEGHKITVGEVISDLLLVPMIVLIAAFSAVKMGLDPMSACVLASFMSLSADRLVRLMRIRFLQRVDAELRREIERTKGMIRDEAQTEISARHVIADTIEGRAPDHYAALDPHPQHPHSLPKE